MQPKPTETSYQNAPTSGWRGIFSEARQPQFASIYVALATIAGALALPYQDTTVSPIIRVNLLLPGLTSLALLVNALLLRRLHRSRGGPDVCALSCAYLLLAAATAGHLATSLVPTSPWLISLLVWGYAACVVRHILARLWSTTPYARTLCALAVAVPLCALAGALYTQQLWPIKIVELLLLASALMLLLAHSQHLAGVEAWVTASVAILMLDYLVEPLAAARGSLPWVVGWLTHLLSAGMLAIMTRLTLLRIRRVQG